LRLFINGLSLDALERRSGIGGLKGHAAQPAYPLALGTLSMEQLCGGYP
jgi:hypothetical protein